MRSKYFEMSILSLIQLYTIVIGLSFVSLIEKSLLNENSSIFSFKELQFYNILTFLTILFVITRFYHGNVVYLYRTYINNDLPVKGAVLFDFWFILLQGGLLFVIVHFLKEIKVLYILMSILILSDSLWMFTIIKYPRTMNQQNNIIVEFRWMFSNLISGGLLIILLLLLPSILSLILLPIIILINSLINYYMNYSYLFENISIT